MAVCGSKPIRRIFPLFITVHSENGTASAYSIPNSEKSSCSNFKLIFTNLHQFLQLIQDEANQTLSANTLLPIDLSSDLPNEFDFKKLIWYSFSQSLNFYRLYCSFQDQIYCLIEKELTVFFHDSQPYFLKMFQDLETKVNKALQSNNQNHLNSFEIISKEYLPKIVEAMGKVVKSYYSHRRFGSLKDFERC